MTFRLLFLLPLTLFSLHGCSPNSEPVPTEFIADSKVLNDTTLDISPVNTIVATVGDETIGLQELDQAIQFTLFDLEWRKYQLRKDMLSRMIVQRQKISEGASIESTRAEILLTPPQPPRVDLPLDKRPIKGKRDAPVLMSVFCSYQSSHCARLQPIIKQLEEHYAEAISFNFYDLPQGFHRYAIAAANAYHCAEKEGVSWAYQNALYADITKLDKPRFMTIAEQLSLDLNMFESCLDERRYLVNIKADVKMATKFGLGSVPVIFINGLYTKGPQNFEAYRYYVDQELAKIGYVSKTTSEQKLLESQLSLTLVATTLSSEASKSTALIKLSGDEQHRIYRVGEQLSEQVQLINVEQDRIIIDNQGRLEFVTLQASTGHDMDFVAPTGATAKVAMELAEAEYFVDQERPERKMKRRTLPATGEMTLSKDWLQGQLINQLDLQAHFYNADHVVEGHHLVKLNDINDQRFYNTLGFKTGDVLLRVNDQWVHEGQNPLWDSLAKEEQVSVVIMRGGYPIRYDYNIQ